MNLDELLNIIDGKILNGNYTIKKINNISIDTRNINKNDIYIALKGKKFDGHSFIKEAILKKCSCIIIDDDRYLINTKTPIIKVSNTYDTLIKLGTFFRNKYINIPLIAITGSVGKTTTKDLIYDILSSKYSVLKNTKNQNNHIGIPLTLFHLNDKINIIITEMGMNHFNEIDLLSKMCKPNIAVITNIGTAHIGNLKSKKNIFKAKMEIVNGMNGGLLIVNGNDKFLKKIKLKNIKTLKCGIRNNLKVSNVKTGLSGTTFDIYYDLKKYNIFFPVPGSHLINDIVLTIQIGIIFDIDINTMKDKIANFHMNDNRLNIIKLKRNILIDDTYNASLESMTGLFNIVKEEERKKIFILGDILELGEKSNTIHKTLIKKLKSINNKEVLLIGKAMAKVKKETNYHIFDTNAQLCNYLLKQNYINCIFIVKGSHAMNLDEIVKRIKFEF